MLATRSQPVSLRLSALLASVILVAACGTAAAPAPAASPTTSVATSAGSAAATPAGSAAAAPINITATKPQEIYSALAKYPRAEREAYLLSRALKEGAVNWYSVTAETVQTSRIKAFMAKYPGITVQNTRLTDDNASQRVELEVTAGKQLADIVTASGSAAFYLRGKGVLADHSGIYVPETYPKFGYDSWYVMSGYNPNLIAYNTKLVKPEEAPKNFQDLLEPKWKGKVAINSIPEDIVQALLIAWGPARTQTYLQKLVVELNNPIRAGSGNIANLLGAGEFPIAWVVLATNIAAPISAGAPIAWVAPEVVAVNTTVDTVVVNAAHPYGAALLLNWLYSVEGARTDAQLGRLPLNPAVQPTDPRFAQFLVQDSALNKSLVILTPSIAAQQAGPSNELIKNIVTPRFTQ